MREYLGDSETFWALIGWDLLASVLIPLFAAAIAAVVVLRQVKQLDRHRVADRASTAIVHLTEMSTEMVEIIERIVDAGQDPNDAHPTATDLYRINRNYVKGMTHLEIDDQDVARWAYNSTHQLLEEARSNFRIQQDSAHSADLVRGAAYKSSAETLQRLLDWQRGTIPSEWFSSQV